MATTYTGVLKLPKHATSDPFDITLINNMADLTDAAVSKAYQGRAAYNHLINSDLLHPQNTRGQTTYTGIGFSIDGWRAYHAETVHTVTSAGLQVSGTANANLYQMLDTNFFDQAKTCTAAACDSEGNVYVWSGTPTDTSYAPVCVYLLNQKPVFRLVGNKTWVWAAVYDGVYTADTLPGYVPKGDFERFLCMRRAVALGGTFRYRAVQIAGSIIDFVIPLPVPMRARPSFDASALTVYDFPAMNTQAGFSFAIVQETANGIVIRATKAGHGLTDAVLNIAAGTVFSADLT